MSSMNSNDKRKEYLLPITELYMLRTYDMTMPGIALVDNKREVKIFGAIVQD